MDKGAVLDAIGGDLSSTPFHWACRSGHVLMATLLLKRGSNLYLIDSQGYNALHLAVHQGHATMVVYLLANGFQVDTRDSMSRTPLMWAAYQGNSIEVMKEILRNNPDIDTLDSTGFTALHWSIITLHFEFAAQLLKEGASHTIKDPSGKTPADWAEERGSLETYNSLIQTYKNNSGKTGKNAFNDNITWRIMYATPFIGIPFVFLMFKWMAFYFAVPFTLLCMHFYISRFLSRFVLGNDDSQMHESPMMSAVGHVSILMAIIGEFNMISSRIN